MVSEPHEFTGTVTVHGHRTTARFIAESWGEAVEVLHSQYGFDSEWVLRAPEPTAVMDEQERFGSC